MKQIKYRVLGVMSGTSLDGIDLALCQFSKEQNGNWRYQILNAITVPYPESWRKKLQDAILLSSEILTQLNIEYTNYLGKIIKEYIDENSIDNLDAVCSHGHTILHEPAKGITLQIGNLEKISEIIGVKVVCDFRVQDVALGGEGAPLVPIGDALLFSKYDYCLNLGGFANVSLNHKGQRVAYDICPVNIVMNVYAAQLGYPFDEDGDIARRGVVVDDALSLLNALPFYAKVPPKSLGLEWVKKYVFPILDTHISKPEDKMATFLAHASQQIAAHFKAGSSILVTGGGAYNSYLLEEINKNKIVDIEVPDDILVEFKEALIFGFLGVLKLRDEVNCLASVTGASKNHSSGTIFT